MALPSTPLLDDFSRPNESPVSWGQRWQAIDTSLAAGPNLTSNRLVDGSSGTCGRYWFGPEPSAAVFVDTEVWATLGAIGSGPASNSIRLWARLGTVGGTNTYTGYFLDQNPNSHTLGLGMAIGNGSTSGLGSLTQNLVAGDTIVLRVVGYTLTAYVISSGVIKTVFSAAATLLVPQGSIGIGLSITGLAGGWKVTSFGGGTIDSLTPGTHPVGGFGAT